MSWNPNNITNATKIRAAPGALQNNWNALANGKAPLYNVLLPNRDDGPGGNPPTTTGAGNVFTRLNGSGNPELWYKDDISNSTRLTNAGGVGYWTQKLYGSQVSIQNSINNAQIANPQQAFCCAYGTVTGGNSFFDESYNMSSLTRNGTGSYTITMLFTATSSANYSVIVTARKFNTSSLWGAFVSNQTSTTFKIYLYEMSALHAFPQSGSAVTFDYGDPDFAVAIYGAFT